jgi:diguanylate cyclase (GGDEF)-like protein
MSETLKGFLKSVDLFSGLADGELDMLTQVATETDYPGDSEIVREGDPGGSLLIVRAGEVRIVRERPVGEEVYICTFRPGDFFGEMSLFDGQPRSATARAVVDSRIIEIGGEPFMTAIAKTPKVALRVLAEIASRIRRTDETICELADEVYREAYYDALTGLANRALMHAALEQATRATKRSGRQVALLFMDLGRFKNVSDSLGQEIGDLLLLAVADRLKNCLREADLVSRLGGDEFAIVLTDLEAGQQAARAAERILKATAGPFSVAGHELGVTPSIGISVYPGDGADARALVRNADSAMYCAKEAGRSNYQFYAPELNTRPGSPRRPM